LPGEREGDEEGDGDAEEEEDEDEDGEAEERGTVGVMTDVGVHIEADQSR
jgi:hypothetical protein